MDVVRAPTLIAVSLLVSAALAVMARPAGSSTRSAPASIVVAFDGAYSAKGATSPQAIEMGLRMAIHEINADRGVLGGRRFELVTTDNRMVPARGVANLKKLAEDPRLLAVFGGRFSPVVLEQLPLAHRLQVPLMAVWSSANGITDHGFQPSYTFRLSLRDSWAMPAMLGRARSLGARRVGILVPNMGWGRSNAEAAAATLRRMPAMTGLGPVWYNLGDTHLRRHYDRLVDEGAEALVLVANDFEASALVRQLADLPAARRIPVVSHWGISGGRMIEESGPTLFALQLEVLQTFGFARARPQALARFRRTARELFSVERLETIEAPVGVGHAYDLMHILAKAVELAGTAERPRVRDALERVPYHDGLVKEYRPPFTPERHDALDAGLLFFARYREDGYLMPLPDLPASATKPQRTP